jgi:hypothetical protein
VLVAHFRSRATLLAVGCALALGHRCASVRPPARNLQDIAAHFGAAAAGDGPAKVVQPASIQWETSRGVVRDLLLGRRVLFLAADAPAEPNDVYRAQVRVAPDGSVLAVKQIRNLTRTPLGDESALAMHQQTAVFATQAFGELQGLSILRLDSASDLEHGDFLNRWLLKVRAYQETADTKGIGRWHLALNEHGPLQVNFEATKLALRSEESGERAVFDLENSRVEQTAEIIRSVSQQHYGSDCWLHTLVDVARDAVGPEPLAWLESHVFHWQDLWRRRQVTEVHAEVVTSPSNPQAQRDPESVWPPPTVPALLSPSEAGEGVWSAAGFEVTDARPASEEPGQPPFARTWIRPDAQRPYARLHLVALDMRRLSLGMEAGFEEPKPKTGPPGRGALTDLVAVRERVVATFNGAFKSLHGEYGMMVDGRVLLPPKPRAASVVVRKDGWVGLGTWSDSTDIPEDVQFFRQNLDPLVADGQVNPAGRQDWGLRLAGGSVVTERSALCRTQAGQLYYAWGKELTGESLAVGLERAGCSYAVHLDMNPGHAGLAFTRIRGRAPEGVEARLAVPEMTMHPKEHVVWSDKDFFYVVDADSQRRVAGVASSDVAWTPSPGPQPPPEIWPALWEGRVELGALPVHLLRIEPGRVKFTLTASTLEPVGPGRAAPRRELATDEMASAIAAVSFGHTTSRTRYGLAFGERVTVPLRTGYGNLVVRSSGELAVATSESDVSATARSKDVIVQLPELVSNGTILPRASLRGERRLRGGVCVTDGGVWFATVDHDSSDAVAVTLKNLGCNAVLELDRGSKHAVNIQREQLAGLTAPEHETGYLWVISSPMQPRTFAF